MIYRSTEGVLTIAWMWWRCLLSCTLLRWNTSPMPPQPLLHYRRCGHSRCAGSQLWELPLQHDQLRLVWTAMCWDRDRKKEEWRKFEKHRSPPVTFLVHTGNAILICVTSSSFRLQRAQLTRVRRPVSLRLCWASHRSPLHTSWSLSTRTVLHTAQGED